uniref:MOSC domain-containing protein n=1 Tax=Amorphochlora amoebiformis TaxID=1561963 RepID=A0A7S0D222_9EUKA|mmetsp:Transcript_16534/g.26193  ORF Transcript_16534/g.26193 Transcript_16534/m.26193 type:complete len:352 (+) Transcript_16534:69-1124(+)
MLNSIITILAIAFGVGLVVLLLKVSLSRTKDRSTVVSHLYVYPVKSLGGVEVDEASVSRIGFRFDRRFIVADKDGMMLSQRKHPRMATLQPSVEEKDGVINLKIHDRHDPSSECEVSVSLEDAASGRYPFVTVEVWGAKIRAARVGDAVSKWLSDKIGVDCYLATVISDSAHDRKLKPKYQVHGHKEDQAGAFSDGFPYLLASEESLVGVNAQLKLAGVSTIGMERFRPNIVVKNVSKPFAEDNWAEIKIGSLRFRVAKPCDRCSMPTIDQKAGVRDKTNQPTRTMKKFRYFSWTKSNGEKAVYFGQNLVCHGDTGKIKRGDKLSVICGTSALGCQTSVLTKVMLKLSSLF